MIGLLAVCLLAAAYPAAGRAGPPPPQVDVAGQPLAASVRRVVDALELLGRPFDREATRQLNAAIAAEDAGRLQELLDPHVLCVVTINPESRVKVERGPAEARLQQAGFVPFLVKVINQGAVKAPLRVSSPQAGPPYAGVAKLSMERQDQAPLRENEYRPGEPRRFLQVELFAQPPLGATLSGLEVEYVVALVYSSDAGRREATLGFDVGQGTQDLGFRGKLPVLFDVRPAVPVKLSVRDHDGKPAYARLTFRDKAGQVYPPQARRLAPDLFFQKQVYRRDGEVVLLPPGEFRVESSRGPEYRVRQQTLVVREDDDPPLEVRLERWVDPMAYGFYCGDHHIHAAGCAHYSSPTQGVTPGDMFRQVAGEGLNVGCVLTWGPCFEFQRQFFAPKVDEVSEPLTVLKYDLEISGFGSQALGHVCLLNLRDQTYPGSGGTKEKGWPTWATPVLRWAKAQGAVTGFAHSASGLQVDPPAAAGRLLAQLDADHSGQLSQAEANAGLLPAGFAALDADRDALVSEAELRAGIDHAADELPNLAAPEMNSVGAMELPVAVAAGACDFISAMDTARVAEWNMWYHVLNCGFALKASGETDFPCMSSTAVGQGRVYVQLGPTERVDFGRWSAALAAGRSYVSDGYAHALRFSVDGVAPGGDAVRLDAGGTVVVRARVAFAPETPESVAYGTRAPEGGRRLIGDTVTLHGPRSERLVPGGERLVEVVVNGRAVASQTVPADGREHDLEFRVPVGRSSWVALRQFPQLHTNPVDVIVAGRPIRASQQSARWCEETIRQLWRVRQKNVAPAERGEAERAFESAIAEYRRRGDEAAASGGDAAAREAPDPAAAPALRVGPVPDALRADWSLSPFYTKYVDANGLPVVSSGQPSDYALLEAAYLVNQMLAHRPDVREAMVRNHARLAVMGYREFTTDIPEHSRLAPKEYADKRARGMGGPRAVSAAEENLLCYPGDPYAAENILIHEFAHGIHQMGLRAADPTFNGRLRAAYDRAVAAGLWKGTYAATNPGEYWAEGVQSWFDTNRENDSAHNHVNTREELKEYDPPLAKLVEEVFGDTLWRYLRPYERAEPPAHLAGYDRAEAPRFAWPRELLEWNRLNAREVERARREGRPPRLTPTSRPPTQPAPAARN